MVAPQDTTAAALLARHLALIKAPIPMGLSTDLAELHMLGRCANLLVDLLLWRGGEESRTSLYNSLHDLYQQRRLSALALQTHLALLLQRAA